MKTYDAVQFGTDTKVSLSRNDWVFGPRELTEADFDFAISTLTAKKEREFPEKTHAQKAALAFAGEGDRDFDILTYKDGKYYVTNGLGEATDEVVCGAKDIVTTTMKWHNPSVNYVTIITYMCPAFKTLDAAVLYPEA